MNKAQEEVSFPRGNADVKALSDKSQNKIPEKVVKRKAEKDLFSNKEMKVDKKKKKAKKNRNEKTSMFDVKSVPSLTYSSLSEGQVLLGFISQILEYELKAGLNILLKFSLRIGKMPTFRALIIVQIFSLTDEGLPGRPLGGLRPHN